MKQKRKLPLNEIFMAMDMNGKSAFNEWSEEERKEINYWLLNRYASSVSGSREAKELAVVLTNENYNKNWNVLGTRHPKLQWQLLCQAGNTQKIQFHQWIGFKKKSGSSDANGIKLLSQIFPNMKTLEVEMLAGMYTKKELKALAEEYNIEGIKF